MQDDSKRLRVHCATLALVLFSLVACSVRGAEAQGRRGRGEQSRSAAQEMARTRVGRRGGARGVGVGGLEGTRGAFCLRARASPPPSPPAIPLYAAWAPTPDTADAGKPPRAAGAQKMGGGLRLAVR